MKILLLSVVILSFVVNSFGSPAIFKIKRDINSGDGFTELARVDTSKYKQIRIVVKTDDRNGLFTIGGFEGENDHFTLDDGAISSDRDYSRTFDLPPANIDIRIKGKGRYSLYVYAQ